MWPVCITNESKTFYYQITKGIEGKSCIKPNKCSTQFFIPRIPFKIWALKVKTHYGFGNAGDNPIENVSGQRCKQDAQEDNEK